jgi:hypothetical protein
MRAAAKFHLLGVFYVVPEYVFAARTDESVVSNRIEHQDEIGEAVDQAAGKFLLLM